MNVAKGDRAASLPVCAHLALPRRQKLPTTNPERHAENRADPRSGLTRPRDLSGSTAALDICDEIGRRGSALLLDDFNTGHSSLLYLRSIPLESVKIDGSFTRDVDTNPDTQALHPRKVDHQPGPRARVIVEGVDQQAKPTSWPSLALPSFRDTSPVVPSRAPNSPRATATSCCESLLQCWDWPSGAGLLQTYLQSTGAPNHQR